MRAELQQVKKRQADLEAENASLKKQIAGGAAAAKPTGAKTAAAKPAGRDLGAEADSALTQAETLKETSEFFAVPDSPAAAVLGIAPEKVIHSTTPKQLIPSVINGLDERGNFQSGFAIDFAPAQLFPSKELPKDDRPTDQAVRNKGLIGGDALDYGRALATRTQLSFATIRGTEEEDKSSRIAIGVHTAFIDDNDPTQRKPDYSLTPREIQRLRDKEIDLATVNPVEYWEKRLNRRWVRDVEPYTDENMMGRMANTIYNHAAFSLGVAGTWISPDGGTDSYDYSGTTAWSTLSFSLDRDRVWPVRAIFHVRYRNDERVPLEASEAEMAAAAAAGERLAQFVREDELLAVGGLRFGTWDFNASATAAYIKRWGGEQDESAFRYSISAEKYVGGNMWLTLSAGREMGNDDSKDETLVLGGVRLGFDGRDFDRGDRAKKTLAPTNAPAD